MISDDSGFFINSKDNSPSLIQKAVGLPTNLGNQHLGKERPRYRAWQPGLCGKKSPLRPAACLEDPLMSSGYQSLCSPSTC